jgi:hypothetical protein
MSDQISGILIAESLKNLENGLTQQQKALNTQNVMLFGQNGAANGKVPFTTEGLIDANTGKSLADTLKYLIPVTDPALYVDMGLPSGLLWAKKNLDATQDDGFAASEHQYECSFFSFGNTDPHQPTANNSFSPYSFGSANDGEPYASSPGASIVYPAGAGPSFDAARMNIGAPWRLPTTEEFKELFDNCDFVDENGNLVTTSTPSVDANARGDNDKRIIMNSIVGIRLKSKINGKYLFFPCSGNGNGASWYDRGAYGYYWSSSLYSATYGRRLSFSSGGVYAQNNSNRFNGFAVRPVQ